MIRPFGRAKPGEPLSAAELNRALAATEQQTRITVEYPLVLTMGHGGTHVRVDAPECVAVPECEEGFEPLTIAGLRRLVIRESGEMDDSSCVLLQDTTCYAENGFPRYYAEYEAHTYSCAKILSVVRSRVAYTAPVCP